MGEKSLIEITDSITIMKSFVHGPINCTTAFAVGALYLLWTDEVHFWSTFKETGFF